MPQVWTCDWEALHIEVANWTRGLRTGEDLHVNGVKVDSNESWLWSRLHAYLASPISVNNNVYDLEVLIGQAKGKLTSRCHIFVGGALIGGDEDVNLMASLPNDWRPVGEKGLIRYLISSGIIKYGLPFAIIMTVLQARSSGLGSPEWQLGSFCFSMLFFGCAMGYMNWRSSQKNFDSATSKLDGPPRFEI